jgi:hypothetical protein
MMRSEAETPIKERYLAIEGRASAATVKEIGAGLPSLVPEHSEVLFVTFAYADLPFPKRYEVVFPKGRPQDGVRCSSVIVAATQQFNKPFPEIPHGWKTICVVHFPAGVPQMVSQLPVVDAWYANRAWVCLCDESTWEQLKKTA